MRWQLTSCFSGCRGICHAERVMRESHSRERKKKQRQTVDSAGNTILLRDSPWANTRLIQAWVGQPWWDPPIDSCEKGMSAISWRDSSLSPSLFVFTQGAGSPLPRWSPLTAPPLCVLNHLCLSVSAADSLWSDCNATVPGEPVTPRFLCDSSDWAKSNPPSSSSLIWEQSRPPPPHSSFHF